MLLFKISFFQSGDIYYIYIIKIEGQEATMFVHIG